ncbi:MAG: type II secretion system F family protein [Planctomycetaceae bacterium]|nr:type II secretion system F family protein [Planctomycetaceae bacterium]MCA9075142.1 type II secretion system F family protein [Planctomycetaceae bacterium]
MTLPGSPDEPVGGSDVFVDDVKAPVGRSLSLDDFVVLNDEIRSFVRAGIPLDIGLRGTASRADGQLANVAARLSEHIEQGRSLEAAIEAEGNVIPSEYRALLEAGRQSGRLPELLSSLSELGQSVAILRRQLRLSMIYPSIVFVLAYTLFTGFVLLVVPQLLRSHVIFRTPETFVIRVLRSLTETVGIWGPIIPGVLLLCVILLFLQRQFLSHVTPLLGGSGWLPGARDVGLSRFSRVLALLVEHGVPFPQACRLSGAASGNTGLQSAGEQLASQIEAGNPMSSALKQIAGFPAFLKWLMTVGEQQGSLVSSLKQATAVYEQRALAKLDWFRRVVPPTLVLLFGGVVTLVYGLSLFIPMTELLRSLEEVSR